MSAASIDSAGIRQYFAWKSREREEVVDRAEVVARLFHERYEFRAPEFAYATREGSAVPWEVVPTQNKLLMVQVALDLVNRGVIGMEDGHGAVRAD